MVSSVGSIAVSANSAMIGLNKALDQVSISTARLASGNRLVRAGDDVGALTQSIKLQTNITSLRQALMNTTQADSFLQTAYSGLSTISDILGDMQALAVQSSSGSVTDAERAFLQTDFLQLSDEIDRLASTTAFNGINLLDGSLAQENQVTTPTTAATQSSATLTFAANPIAGDTVIVNNITLTANVDFTVGATTNDTLNSLRDAVNNSTNLSLNNLEASVVGNLITFSDRGGGTRGIVNTINDGGSTANFTTTGGTTISATRYSFSGGLEDGLSRNSVVEVNGSVGDALVNTMNQTQGEVILSLAANPGNGQTLSIDSGNGGSLVLTYQAAPGAATDIQIGATPEETIQNTIETIRAQAGGERYVLDQIDFIRDGANLIMRSRLPGNPVDLVGAQINLAEGVTFGVLSTATFNTGVNTGVNTSGVTNDNFIGTVSGFSATFNAGDDITADITVGSFTYRAEINDTTPAAATFQRFRSTTAGGGYFDVELAAAGLAVTNQADADTFAARLDAAFSTLDFSQNRIASSFTGVGDLAGATFEFQLGDFSDVTIDSLSVTAPSAPGQSATLQIGINGETFQSGSNLGDSISEYEIVELASTTTSNKITLRMGNVEADLSSQALADGFKADIEAGFDLGNGTGSVSFQIGAQSDNTLEVSIGSASINTLFNGQTIDVLSQANATAAQPVIDDAIDTISGLLAEVGALQERTVYAADSLNNEILYKDQARSALADTDIGYEATMLALATVQAQSAIAVLAQTQSMARELVSLVKTS